MPQTARQKKIHALLRGYTDPQPEQPTPPPKQKRFRDHYQPSQYEIEQMRKNISTTAMFDTHIQSRWPHVKLSIVDPSLEYDKQLESDVRDAFDTIYRKWKHNKTENISGEYALILPLGKIIQSKYDEIEVTMLHRGDKPSTVDNDRLHIEGYKVIEQI